MPITTGYKAKNKDEHSQSKIKEVDSLIIQECIEAGFTTKEIANYFKVSTTTILDIKDKTHWTNFKKGYKKYRPLVLDLNTGVYYSSASEVARLYGVSQPTVHDRITNPRPSNRVLLLNLAYV